MTKIVKHTEQTRCLNDSSSQLYKFLHAFFYGLVQSHNYIYDDIASHGVAPSHTVTDYKLKPQYTYDVLRQRSALAFCNLKSDYDYFCCNMTVSGNTVYNDDSSNNQLVVEYSNRCFDYFGARYYASDLSIWLSVDPLAPRYPRSSPYAYVENNPIMFVDPNGMYKDPANAQKSQEKATEKYGADRVGDVHNSGTNDNPNHTFNIYKEGQDKYSHGQDDGSVMAYKPTNISNDSEYNTYESSNATSSSVITPFGIGVEWLSGEGPRHRDFTNGDLFTEMLRKHNHISSTKNDIKNDIQNGIMSGENPYDLSGVQGVGKYVTDYSTLGTGGTTGNLAVTYLGSFTLIWEVNSVNGNSANVTFTVQNSSTIQSATRPPVIGYTDWWKNSIGARLNTALSSGPMSKTSQTIQWTETISW